MRVCQLVMPHNFFCGISCAYMDRTKTCNFLELYTVTSSHIYLCGPHTFTSVLVGLYVCHSGIAYLDDGTTT
jgi:hypothetical protein